jgi:hypothetical protein
MKGMSLAVFFFASLAAGCARIDTAASDLSARCAATMQQAFPGGDIKITSARSHPDTARDYATIVSDVAGVRQDIPAGSPNARRVAAQCRYENGVLMQFAWTEGPLQQAAAAWR